MTKTSDLTLTTLIDRLGKAQALVSDVTAKRDELKEELKRRAKAQNIEKAEAKLFRVTIATYPVKRCDYSSVVKSLRQTSKLLGLCQKHSTTKMQTKVTITARNGN